MSVIMAKKKPDKPKPHRDPRESFHLPEEMQNALLRYCSDQPTETDKSAVLRRALREFLEREGYLPKSKGSG